MNFTFSIQYNLKTSIEFLRGSKLDYVEDLMRASFRITVN